LCENKVAEKNAMARRPEVRYFKTRKAYYFQHKGKQHKLAVGPDDWPTGPTFLAAQERYREILSLAAAPHKKDDNTCEVVFELYLKYLVEEKKVAATTFAMRERHLSLFAETFAPRLIKCLTVKDVTDWYKARVSGGWSEGTVRIFLESLMSCLNWAASAQVNIITKNPLQGIDMPDANSRGEEAVITQEQHEAVLKVSKSDMQLFCSALRHTGARPSEIANATAADWDDKRGCLCYKRSTVRRKKPSAYKHKNARKGKDRLIFFRGSMLDTMRKLVAQYPEGKLFRTLPNRNGSLGRWTEKTISKRFGRLQIKLSLPNLTAYSYRHTFATEWLMAGKSETILATLLGNSPAIILRHYAHLLVDVARLHSHLDAFFSGNESPQKNEND